jgi:hypothetical protein
VNEADDDPHRLARLFVDDHQADDVSTVCYWRSEFYRWCGGAYRTVPEKEIRAELVRRIKGEFDRLNLLATENWSNGRHAAPKGKIPSPPVAKRVTTRLAGDVRQALESLILLPGSEDPSCWLDREEPFPARETLAAQNLLVHLPAFAEGKVNFSCAPTPRYFTRTALDYDFDPKGPKPVEWLKFLNGRLEIGLPLRAKRFLP